MSFQNIFYTYVKSFAFFHLASNTASFIGAILFLCTKEKVRQNCRTVFLSWCKLAIIKVSVKVTLFHQASVAALLNDRAVFHDQDQICIFNGR